MGQNMTDFILLRAMYDGDLSQAIFDKDEQMVWDIILDNYNYDIKEGIVRLGSFDINELYMSHINEIEELNSNPKLVSIYI